AAGGHRRRPQGRRSGLLLYSPAPGGPGARGEEARRGGGRGRHSRRPGRPGRPRVGKRRPALPLAGGDGGRRRSAGRRRGEARIPRRAQRARREGLEGEAFLGLRGVLNPTPKPSVPFAEVRKEPSWRTTTSTRS